MALKGKNTGNCRSFTGELRNLERKGEFLFSVEIWLLNDAVNRNGWQYTELERHMAQFAGTPILVAYTRNGNQIGDGHNFREEYDAEGNPAPSFTDATAERIVGAISEDINDIRLESRGGNTWVVAKGTLWRWYAKELVEKIERDARQGRDMSISIETLVTKWHMEGKVEVEEEYKILGTTILGDHVMPAVADAHIAALAKRERFEQLKMRAASYQNPADGGTKPQKNTKTKGLKTLELFNKPQCEKLQERFTGYTVLCAAKGDSSIHVALRNDNWELFAYEMANETETVAPERIVSCAAAVDFGNGLRMDAFELVEATVKALSAANAELEGAKNQLGERDNQIKAMRETEEKRRVSAAKVVAKQTLEKFNRERADKIGEEAIADITKDIDSGIYTNTVNAEGEWTGDSAVENAVYAVCGRKVQEMEAQAAENSRKAITWRGKAETQPADGGTVSDLLSRKGIR